MINIAILDDEEIYLEKERKITANYFAAKGIECNIEACQNSKWFLYGIEEEHYDLYILDVEMPEKNGLEIAREIRRLYPEPVIIFVTNFIDYAIEAYEVNTYRYIPKEVLEQKLPEAYETLLPEIMEKEERYYIIKRKSDVEKIGYTDIYYLKKEGKYAVIIHKAGESRVRKSLTEVLQELDAREFTMVDKSYIVNLKHVMKLMNHDLYLRDGSILPIGMPRLGQVKRAITEYWR
ncbi:MAG: LytTR family DNA-binding domain-containing protein [Lachnospiraceae bacterium]|nr:LytTR family DNA-binding domain-containing protein [Lachnospiraceae bacterium]MDD3794788.1 LytTR family DNA-binding domain-containing protein [Lachnospiraceae bacterium]